MANCDSKESFPSLLHRLLTDIDRTHTDLRETISWLGNGMAFKIHDRQKFIDIIMPIWFHRWKYSSLVRQLSQYGFKRVLTEGDDKGALYHESFIRDMPELAAGIEKANRKGKAQQQEWNTPYGRMQYSLSAPLLHQTPAPTISTRALSAPPSPEGLGDLMLSSSTTAFSIGIYPPLPSHSFEPGTTRIDSWFARAGTPASSQIKLKCPPLVMSDTREQQEAQDPQEPWSTQQHQETEDPLEPLNVFDGFWSAVLEPDAVPTMPQNEPLSGCDDMEPLRVFAPGADGGQLILFYGSNG